MKRLLTIAVVLISLSVSAQDCDNYLAVTGSYIIPKTVGAGADYFTAIGFTGGISAGIDLNPGHTTIKQGANTYEKTGNQLDIYAYAGWRVFRIDYTVSVFANVGYTMGDVNEAQPFGSVKILFPINTHAVSIEPMYVNKRGFGGKLSYHFRL